MLDVAPGHPDPASLILLTTLTLVCCHHTTLISGLAHLVR